MLAVKLYVFIVLGSMLSGPAAAGGASEGAVSPYGTLPLAPIDREGSAGKAVDARLLYKLLLKRETQKTSLPYELADAVMAIESGYDPSVIGGVGEIGLMQVLPSTATMLGFKGDTSELAKPETNIHYGVTYLAKAWRLANGDVCRTLMKYRAGHGEEMMTPLSVTYCGRARAHLAAMGSPLAAGIPLMIVVDAASPLSPRLRPAETARPKIRTVSVSQAFWLAHDLRVKAITARLEAKWRRVAAR